MRVVVNIFDKNKYNNKLQKIGECHFKIVAYEVKEVLRDEATEKFGTENIDENNEYLILHFENGDIYAFRNSRVNLFREWIIIQIKYYYDRCKELDTSSVIGIYFRDKNGENMLIFDAY